MSKICLPLFSLSFSKTFFLVAAPKTTQSEKTDWRQVFLPRETFYFFALFCWPIQHLQRASGFLFSWWPKWVLFVLMNDHDDYIPLLFIQYPKKSIGNRSGNHSKVSLPFQWNSILDRKRKKKDAIWNCLFLHEESGKKGKINLHVVYSSIPRLSVSPENWISVCLLAKHIINFARLFGTHNYSYRQLIRIPAKHFFMPNPSSGSSPNHFTISKFQGGGKKKSMTKRRNVLDSVELGM